MNDPALPRQLDPAETHRADVKNGVDVAETYTGGSIPSFSMAARYPTRRAGDTATVRLTRKLAERIDGIDLSRRQVGDVLLMPSHHARLLVAEGWAEIVPPEATDPLRPQH